MELSRESDALMPAGWLYRKTSVGAYVLADNRSSSKGYSVERPSGLRATLKVRPVLSGGPPRATDV